MDVLGAVAACMRAFADCKTRLGGQHHAVPEPALGDELAQHVFTPARGVNIGGVDEVAACVNVGIKNSARVGFSRAPARHAKGHGAQRQRADSQA